MIPVVHIYAVKEFKLWSELKASAFKWNVWKHIQSQYPTWSLAELESIFINYYLHNRRPFMSETESRLTTQTLDPDCLALILGSGAD